VAAKVATAFFHAPAHALAPLRARKRCGRAGRAARDDRVCRAPEREL